jgi:SAM-dependent methyltransferase
MTASPSAPDEPAQAYAQRLVAAGRLSEAVGELIVAFARGRGDVDAARLLARLVGRYRLEPSPDVERGVRAACACPDFDLQALVRPAVDCLFQRPEWQDALQAPPARRQDAAVRAVRSGRLMPFNDPLLRAILTRGICHDIRLERILVALRAALLKEGGPELPADVCELAAALARQAANNEYAWPTTAAEDTAVAAIADRLAGGVPSESEFLRYAMYRAPAALPDLAALRGRPWSAATRALIEAVAPDDEELALRSAMPRSAVIADAVSAEVRAQYEESPYPRWLALNPPNSGERRARLLSRCPAADRGRFAGPIDVLIAGCGTGRQAIMAALGYGPSARMTAIDLSASSLAYAQRMARRYGVAGIEFLQADLLDLGRLARRFDVIEAIGVLHHLADPLAGWRVLAQQLKPGGLLSIGLYSERGRQDVVAARREIASLGLPPTPDGVRRLRRIVLDAPDDARDWRVGIRQFTDFFSLSGCRDLLFNVQEHRFTPAQIAAALAGLGLELCAVEAPAAVLAAYRQRFPDDPAALDLARWDRFEADNPRIFAGMIGLWCAKR